MEEEESKETREELQVGYRTWESKKRIKLVRWGATDVRTRELSKRKEGSNNQKGGRPSKAKNTL